MFLTIGVVLILAGVAIAIYWLLTGKRNKPLFRFVCLLTVVTGFLLIVKDRIIEVTLKDVFSVKTVVDQAKADAGEISSIKKRVQDQSATIDLVANEALTAKHLAEEVAKEITSASVQLGDLSNTLTKANVILSNVTIRAEFADLMVKIENDDRHAFEAIGRIGSIEGHPYRDVAESAYLRAIKRAVAIRDEPDDHLTARELLELENWDDEQEKRAKEKKILDVFGSLPSTISDSQFFKVKIQTAIDDRPRLFKVLWNRCSAIPEYYKLNTLMVEMERTPSTKVLATVCALVEQKAKIGASFLEPEKYVDWWEHARSTYPEDKAYQSAQEYYSSMLSAWRKLYPDQSTNKVIRYTSEFVRDFNIQWNQEHPTNQILNVFTNAPAKPPLVDQSSTSSTK
ncbi:MAG: hypothetical protein WCS70_12905 [Verrucomicrobiota bacterium]